MSIDEFDIRAGGTAEEIVERTWAEWEADGMEEQWLEQQDDLEGLDPHQCYDSWKVGWKVCAVSTIDEHLERMKDRDDEHEHENPPAGWWRKRPAKDQPCYATKSAALAKFLDVNYEIVENYGGADYKVGTSEFDAINRKYDLKGKRAARSIADAVWAAMPVGKPYCLDRIDLDALNDTSPVHEAGVPFRLPDVVYESQLAAEEVRHYAPAPELEEPSWVTEHRRFPALPPLPYRLQLEEQEPGVATFSMHTDEEGEPMPAMPPPAPRTAPRRPLTKPSEFKRETSEPGVETYSINPAGMVKIKMTSTRSGKVGWIRSDGTPSDHESEAGFFTPGEAQATIAEYTENLVRVVGRCANRFEMLPNPPPGEHHRRVAASKGRPVSKDTFYLLDDGEVVIDRFDNLNDALTALAQLGGDGRIALGDDDGRDIIAWTGPPYAEDGDPEMGELAIVDARDIRRMFSLAMIRRFNELRDKRAAKNPKGKTRTGVHVDASSPRMFREFLRLATPYIAKRADDGSFTVIDETRWKAIMSSCEAHEVKSPKQNPAWVTKILSKHFVKLEEEVPPRFLPKITKAAFSRGGRISATMKEYGCGAYGCVLPTLDPSVVLKLTTDDTEAEFANDLAGKLTKPVVVKYHMTRELPDKYKGRPSFLLWRDAADHVGQVEQTIAEESGVDPTIIEEAIGNQHAAAQAAYEALDDGEPAIELLQKWEDAAREMGLMVPELRELAEGMITNLQKDKVFMGDVHSGNIGRVKGHWVVVDPGHIAVLTA
jgi:hypothetical protein